MARLAARVARAIAAAERGSTHCIELEFTEGALIENSFSVKQAVTQLKDLGVSIALDDFRHRLFLACRICADFPSTL